MNCIPVIQPAKKHDANGFDGGIFNRFGKPHLLKAKDMSLTESQIPRPREIHDMPDLSGLDNKLRLNLVLNAISLRADPSNVKARALWTNYIKLVDHLIRDYIDARISLVEAAGEHDTLIGPLFRASTQMEMCLINLKRAVRFARRFRFKRDCPDCEMLSVTSDEVLTRISEFIRAHQTLEDRILNREIDEKDPIILQFTKVGVEVGEEKIAYVELAQWIEELNRLAVVMTEFRELEEDEA